MANPWLGEGSSATVAPKKTGGRNLLGNVSRELRAFGAAVPRLPSLLTKEAMATLRVATPGGLGVEALERARIPYLSRLAKESGVEAEEKQKQVRQAKTPGAAVHAISQLPGVRLLPGSFVVGEAARGRQGARTLYESPVSTVLDVLPGVGKVGKIATKATRPGRALIAEAAEVASKAGKVDTALRMAEKGLNPREIAVQVGRRAEKRLPEAVQPSKVLERTGLGGVRTRSVARLTQVAGRRATNELTDFTKGAVKRADELGLTPDDVTNLTRRFETEATPGWRAALPEKEGAFVRWYEEAQQKFTRRGLESKELFEYDGEIYSRADPANRELYKQVRRADTFMQGAQKRLARQFKSGGGGTKGAEMMARAEEATKAAEALAANAVPTRFRGVMTQRLRKTVAGKLGHELDDNAWNEILGDMNTQMPRRQVQKLAKELAPTWRQMREEGYDPIFLHHVDADTARKLARPSLHGPIKAESAYKAASWWDQRPYVQNAQVGLTRQSLESLQRIHGRRLIDDLAGSGFLNTVEDVRAKLVPEAQRIVERRGGDVRQVLNDLLNSRYEKVNLEAVFPVTLPGLAKTGWLAPKGLGKVLVKAAPPQFGALRKAWDAQLGVFRFSVLTMNPMYIPNNLLSGAILVGARSPKALRFRNIKKAWTALREGNLPEGISVGGQTGERAVAAHTYKTGRTIGRMLAGMPAGGKLGAIRDLAGRPVSALQNFAEFTDNMYKGMAYFDSYERLLKKGLDPTVARAAGEEAANRVLINFDTMTPFERQVVRQVIPFYSWSRYILGYVASYPFDHPLRASVVSTLARNEFDDWQSGLPERFQSYFLIGQPDEQGKRIAMSSTGIFPFADTANYFTLAGILSRVDPRISVLLQQAGMDEITSNAELHPNLAWDPVAGRETVKRPPFVRSALGAVVPQAGSAIEILNASEEMRDLRESDPDAWARRVLGELGLRFPLGPARRISEVEEMQKARKAQKRVESSQRRKRRRPVPAGSSGGGNPWLG